MATSDCGESGVATTNQTNIWFQPCSDNCVQDMDAPCELVSVEFGEKQVNNSETTYALGRKGWVACYRSTDAPSTPENTIVFSQKACQMKLQLVRPQQMNVYAAYTDCDGRLCYIEVSPNNTVKSIGGATVYNSRDKSTDIQRTITYEAPQGSYFIGAMTFGQDLAPVQSTTAGSGVVNPSLNANCGGTCTDPLATWYEAHVRVNATAAGNPYVVYSLNGVIQPNSVITAALVTDNIPQNVPAVIVGGNLVVPFNEAASHGYYYAQILSNGQLGAWIRVATGFPVAGASNITGMYTDGSQLFFSLAQNQQAIVSTVGAGATLINNVTTQNMNAVDGCGGYVLRGGANMGLMLTVSGIGQSVAFTLPVGSVALPVGTSVTAVDVISSKYWRIGTSVGRVFETRNGGNTWVEVFYGSALVSPVTSLTSSSNGQVQYVGIATEFYRNIASGSNCGTASGARWSRTNWVTNFPTGIGNITSVTVPNGADDFTAANYAYVSYLNGTDGVTIAGAPTIS